MSALIKPKTNDQLRAIFGLGKQRGCEKADLEQMAFEMTDGKVERLSLLSFDQANAMIVHLGGEAFPTTAGKRAPRTENYHRQKAGIKRVESAKHLTLIDELARLRDMSAEGLEKLCRRVIKKAKPTTTAEGNKIVEALKAMNKRDGVKRNASPRTRRAA